MPKTFSTSAIVALLAIAACAPFVPALGSFFVGDDFDFLRIVDKMDDASDALRSTFWGEYMPAFTLSFMLDMKVWGVDAVGYHVTSLAFHVAAVLALFWLTLTLTGGDRTIAAAAALLFAAQPIHDEAVIYIAARGHVMSTTFVLIALTFHARYRLGGHALQLVPATLSLALALFSKETALLAPALIVAAELFVFRDRRLLRILSGVAPFVLLSAGYAALRIFALGVPDDKVGKTFEYGWEWARLPTYFLLDTVPFPGWWLEEAVLPVLVLPGALAATAALFWAARRYLLERHGVALYALAFFGVCTAPFLLDTLGLRRRYAYPGSVGTCLFLAVVLVGLWRTDTRWKRGVGASVLALLVALGVAATAERSLLYRTSGRIARGMAEQMPSIVEEGLDHVTVFLFQLPYRVGGSSLDGAYLLHRTDFRSLVRFFGGVPKASLHEVIDLSHAEDHRAEARLEPGGLVVLKLTSRTAKAHRALVEELENEEGTSTFGQMRIQRVDDVGRTAIVTLRLAKHGPSVPVLMFSEGRLQGL